MLLCTSKTQSQAPFQVFNLSFYLSKLHQPKQPICPLGHSFIFQKIQKKITRSQAFVFYFMFFLLSLTHWEEVYLLGKQRNIRLLIWWHVVMKAEPDLFCVSYCGGVNCQTSLHVVWGCET